MMGREYFTTMKLFFLLFLFVLVTVSVGNFIEDGSNDPSGSVKWWREDGRCGVNYKLPNGRPAECNPLHPMGHTCCSDKGWCGKTSKHCQCPGCIDYTARWRKDLRCGEEYALPNGYPAQCDPFHPQGKSCCSDLGWCGKLAKHCSCPDCQDFRALWRKDLRCGPMFKLPNGMPAQCDPRSAKKYSCCSKKGWCGASVQHCKCRGCVKFTDSGPIEFNQSTKKWNKVKLRGSRKVA
ncbi:hypothetical protein ACHWQZ_G019098 [Mnemiopsis leidyi]